VDGEIALMLGARQIVARELQKNSRTPISLRPEYTRELAQRLSLLLARMQQSPVACAESYPDECWMFCTAIALVALRMHDVLEGTDHSKVIQRFLDVAKRRLIEPKTGLLVSSFTLNGAFKDGPEGSSLWMVVHCLKLLDPTFAREQYERTRQALELSVFGYRGAREWPSQQDAEIDVDVGLFVPWLGAAAASSAFSILGATSFDDEAQVTGALASLQLFAAPTRDDTGLYYARSNALGDAVILYGLVQGPLWSVIANGSTDGAPQQSR
jgi:hypothetical protein